MKRLPFERALQLWVASRSTGEHAALDGKTARGSAEGVCRAGTS